MTIVITTNVFSNLIDSEIKIIHFNFNLAKVNQFPYKERKKWTKLNEYWNE